tara:strand:- start:5331 stop:5627 length:297 start_codon:yes stop_codon:yes gene_type:complete
MVVKRRNQRLTMDWVTALGIVAGIFTTSGVVPQLAKAIKTKEVNDLSPFMFFILLCGVFMWVVYGIQKQDMPIILMNSISFILNSVMLLLYFLFKNKK